MLTEVVKFMLAHLVVALMVSLGLAARPRDLRQIIDHWGLYARVLLVLIVGVPLLAMAIVSGLGLPRAAGGLVLLMAICPGAPFIPLATRAKGESHSVLGLNALVLSSVLAPLTIPAWVAILNQVYAFEFRITPQDVVVRVLELVILPLALGFAMRSLAPRVAAVAGELVHGFFIVALLVAVVVAVYLGAGVIIHTKPIVLLGVFFLVVGSVALGYAVAPGQPDQQRTTAVTAVLGNPGLALTVIAASYPGFKEFALIIAYVLFRKIALTPFDLLMKWRASHARAAVPAT